MMPDHEHYEQWLSGRRNVTPPPGFADRVMARLGAEPPAVKPGPRSFVDAQWFRVAACLGASVVFILRLGCAYSLFFAF